MNNYLKENKYNKVIKKLGEILIVSMLLIFCGTLSFFITDRLTNNKYSKEATVFSSNTELSNNTIISLMEGDQVIEDISIQTFKNDNGISIPIDKQFLVDYYKIQDYKFVSVKDNKIYFQKKSKSTVLEPDKYYIGEKDGFLAIYKTDNKGKPFIEDEKDIKKDNRLVETLPEKDIERIKNFKIICNSKVEAEDRISAFY